MTFSGASRARGRRSQPGRRINRSHYEDVLVTRVHKLVDKKTCARRYEHIRDFEALLGKSGTTILKFFLHISREEQLARFAQRLDNRVAIGRSANPTIQSVNCGTTMSTPMRTRSARPVRRTRRGT